jgi:hypothetical protein
MWGRNGLGDFHPYSLEGFLPIPKAQCGVPWFGKSPCEKQNKQP